MDLTVFKKYTFILFILLSLSPDLFSQDLPYARTVVDTLASQEMLGRGYVDNGDKKAANYIRDQFDKFGLKTFSDGYFQEFEISVNALPGEMEVSVNGQQLTPGEDFLVDAGSPSISGTFETVYLPAEDLLSDEKLVPKLQNAEGKFLIIEPYDKSKYEKEQQKRIQDVINFLKYAENHPAAGTVVLSNDKLTWGGATTQHPKPSLTITADSLDTPVEKLALNIESTFYDNYPTQNVLGYVEGESTDSLIVFIGHYDHLGAMGENTYFPGANDNASGIAMMLNLAKYYSENKPEFNTAFIAFGAEEVGLLGSRHFTEHPLFELDKIKFLINFDLAGTGDDGIQVVNGSVYRDKFDRLRTINDEMDLLPQIKIRGEACNSDHCFFHRKNVPLFYIYTLGGIKAYHDIYDVAATLPLTEFEDYFILITEFVESL